MRSLLLLALFGAAALVSGQNNVPVDVTDCGGDIYVVKSVEASSWPPIPGTSGVSLTSTAVLSQAIDASTNATWTRISKFSGIDVDSASGNLCDGNGSFGDFKCPQAAGTVVVNSATGDVPKPPFGLKGEVVSVVQILINGQLAGCSSTKFNV